MLETEIKALTQAVKLLTERLDSLTSVAAAPTAPDAVEPTPAPEPVKPEPAEAEPSTKTVVTKDALQSWALKMVRDDKNFKGKLMSALSDHGVKTISQLPDNDAAEAVLKALGGEL